MQVFEECFCKDLEVTHVSKKLYMLECGVLEKFPSEWSNLLTLEELHFGG